MRVMVFVILLFTFLPSKEIKCFVENERIYCKYFIDRSDNEKGKRVQFYWHSPSGKDDRKRVFKVPPYYGSVYDYRFLPGREKGKWVIEVKDLDTNNTVFTTLIIKESNEEFFEE